MLQLCLILCKMTYSCKANLELRNQVVHLEQLLLYSRRKLVV